jgi:hypothetical protein
LDVVPEQARDRAATHDGLHDRRESEAEEQRPEDPPAHRPSDLERVHDGVGYSHRLAISLDPRGGSLTRGALERSL